MKINDVFEYHEEINLSKYLIDETNSEDCLYSLHSVVVHKGNINSGHYYAFIKPTIEDSWLKFNDESVRPASKVEALQNNFGGVFINYTLLEKDIFENKSLNDSNAYILIYIQNSSRSSILQPLDLITDVNTCDYLDFRST
jgi:ubiquitin carboxyl-terminal hydrolase 7